MSVSHVLYVSRQCIGANYRLYGSTVEGNIGVCVSGATVCAKQMVYAYKLASHTHGIVIRIKPFKDQ